MFNKESENDDLIKLFEKISFCIMCCTIFFHIYFKLYYDNENNHVNENYSIQSSSNVDVDFKFIHSKSRTTNNKNFSKLFVLYGITKRISTHLNLLKIIRRIFYFVFSIFYEIYNDVCLLIKNCLIIVNLTLFDLKTLENAYEQEFINVIDNIDFENLKKTSIWMNANSKLTKKNLNKSASLQNFCVTNSRLIITNSEPTNNHNKFKNSTSLETDKILKIRSCADFSNIGNLNKFKILKSIEKATNLNNGEHRIGINDDNKSCISSNSQSKLSSTNNSLLLYKLKKKSIHKLRDAGTNTSNVIVTSEETKNVNTDQSSIDSEKPQSASNEKLYLSLKLGKGTAIISPKENKTNDRLNGKQMILNKNNNKVPKYKNIKVEHILSTPWNARKPPASKKVNLNENNDVIIYDKNRKLKQIEKKNSATFIDRHSSSEITDTDTTTSRKQLINITDSLIKNVAANFLIKEMDIDVKKAQIKSPKDIKNAAISLKYTHRRNATPRIFDPTCVRKKKE